MACSAASTAAAPLMSAFIVSIAFGGLSESPPESKVMPLPAKHHGTGGIGVGVLEPNEPGRVH